MVDRQSGTIDGFDSHPLGLDPFDLNKFSGPHDYYYRLVSDELMKVLKGLFMSFLISEYHHSQSS